MILLNKFTVCFNPHIDGINDFNRGRFLTVSMAHGSSIDAIFRTNAKNHYYITNQFVIKTICQELSIDIRKRYVAIILNPNSASKTITMHKNASWLYPVSCVICQNIKNFVEYYSR